MFDPVFKARHIAEWSTIVGELPKELTAALDRLEAVQSVEGTPRPDPAKVTVANADSMVREYAAALAAEKVLYESRNRIADAIARDILEVAGQHAEALHAALVPAFDAAAQAYREAIEGMGDTGHTPSELLAAGPAAVANFHRAVECERDLDQMAGWISSVASLPRYAAAGHDPICAVLRPSTRAELQALVNVQGRGGDLKPLYLTAVELGVPFSLNMPDEAAEIRATINALPVRPRALAPGEMVAR